MKKIHLLAAFVLISGVSCLHVKRDRLDAGAAFSWWPANAPNAMPLAQAVEPIVLNTHLVETSEVIKPDKSEVVVGGRLERAFDHPGDNSVRFQLENGPDSNTSYLLEYELNGVGHPAELLASWNDELSAGGSWLSPLRQWIKVRELVHPDRLQKGENVLRFNRNTTTEFYELKNIQLAKHQLVQETSVLLEDESLPVYGNIVVIRLYAPQNLELQVEGKVYQLHKGRNVIECEIDKQSGALTLMAKYTDGKVQQLIVPIQVQNGAQHRELVAVQPGEEVQAYKAKDWIHEGDYVNLTAYAGAVAEDVRIHIQPLRKQDLPPLAPGMINVTAGAAGYRLLPDNIHFERNIRLSLRIDSVLVPKGFSPAHVRTYYFDEEKRSWTMLPQDSLEKNGLWAGAYTDHFTDFVNAIIKAPELPNNQGNVPTSFSGLSAANPLEGVNQISAPSANAKGDLALSFPIEIPKGRNGLEPSLQLTYNSSGGNGYFGLGWNMSFPNIQVDTRWGVPRYSTTAESEAYLVNGEQLEEVAHQIMLNGQRNPNSIKEYRYRVEGKFDKILRHGTGPENYTWEVHEKSGRIYYYGKKKIETDVNLSCVLKGPNGIAYWALAEVEDQHGNQIVYSYAYNSNAIARILIPDNIQYSLSNSGANRYRIKFTTLINGDPPINPPIIQNRPDASIDMRFGFPVVMDNLVKGISVYFDTEHIRSYFLNYKEGAFKKMLLCNILEHTQLGQEPSLPTLDGIQNIMQGSCSAGEDESFSLAGNQKLHRFSYENFDIQTKSIFGPPTSLGGSTKPLQLLTISDNGGNVRSSVDFLDLIKYPLGLLTLQEKGTLSQSRTINLGGNAGLYAGLGANVFAKSNSITGSLGGSMGWSRTTVGFFDVDGDGYPDRIYKTSNGYFYQSVIANGNSFSLNPNELALIDLNGIASSNSYQWSWGIQGQALGLFNANYNKSKSTTITDQYFADVDADGFVDLVDGQFIWYNRINPNGGGRKFIKPTSNIVYIDNCNFIDQSGQIDPDLGKEYDFPVGAKELEIEKKLADQNAVSVWVAPRQGTINIESNISMKTPDFIESWQQSYANGVQFRIQHNTNEIVSDSLMYDEFSPAKNHYLSFHVQPGDLIFFRLLSKGNRDFDEVDWLRKITYDGNNSLDADGLSNIEFKSDNDFLASQDQKLQMPFKGVVEISLDISSSELSEELILKIQKNNDPPIESRVFSAGGVINYSFFQNEGVDEGDYLLFELIGNSKVDYTKLQIDPIVRYLEIEGSTMPTGSEWAEVKIIPIVNLKPFGRNFAKSISNSINGGAYTVSPQLTVTGNYTGEVYLTAKLLNTSLGGMTIEYSGGNISYPNGSSFNISLSSVENVYFDYSFSSPIESFGITLHNVSISGSSNYDLKAGVHMPYDAMFKKFGTLYRGWGQFVYAGIQEDPIDLNLLNSNLQSYVGGLPAVSGELNLAPGIGSMPATAEDMEATAMSSHAQAFLNNPFYEMFVDPKNNEWFAPGAYGRVSKSTLYNTLRQNELESRRISNPIPVATSSHNGKAILKKHIQETKTWGAGAGPSILRASGTKSEGIGKILSDFRDMNGDGYPDNMSFEKIQFTNPRGGLQDGGSVVFPSSFNSTSSKSNGTSLGGGPKSWTKEVNVVMLSTEGFVSTQAEKETTAGVAAGWGDNTEKIGLFDFNGDGLPDLLLDNKWVRLNRGYGFETSRNWDLTIDVSESGSLSYGPDVGLSFVRKMLAQKSEDSWSFGLNANRSENNVRTIPIDINGDGLLDFLTTSGGTDTNLVLHLNTGLKYEIYNSVGWSGDDYTPKSVTNSIGGNGASSGGVTGGLFKFGANIAVSLNFAFSRDRGTFIDVNNDGYVDYVEDEPLDNNLKVHYNQIGKTNLLRKVETVTGVSMEFKYEPLITSVEMPKSKWLFTELIVDDKFAADSNGQSIFTYSYHNPNYHRFERVFLGFDSVITNQWGGNILLVQKRERFHNQDIYFTGLKYRESLVNPTTSPIQYWIIKTFDYKHHSITTGAVLTNPACGDPFYPALESEITVFTEGLTTTDFWTKKSYTRGPKGVITGFVDIGDQADANDDYSAVIEYTESTTKYIIGLPTRIRVYSGSTLLREREAMYNNANGNLTSMRVLLSGPSGSGQYAVDDYQYDNYGNITKHIFPPNANGQRYEMTYTYDNVLYSFPVSVSDYWGLTNTFTYNYLLGKPITFTDAYGGITSYQYNFNGKTLSITGPKEQNAGMPTLDYAYWDDVPYDYPLNVKTYWAETRHFDPVSPPIRTILFTDGLGHQLQVKKTAFVADNANSSPTLKWVVSGWQKRDTLGRVIIQWYPTTSNISSGTDYDVLTTTDIIQPTLNTYDVLNRPTTKTYPDGSTETMIYSLSNQNGPYSSYTGVVDDLGNSTVALKDIQGNTLESIRNQVNITRFTYTPLGELLTSVDPESKTTYYSYDKAGRLLERNHPDAGMDVTAYDPSGNVIVRKRNNQHLNGTQINYSYDYNRLMEISYPDNPENNVYYEYGTSGNSRGRILRVEDGSGAQEFEYGSMGEVVRKINTLIDLNQFAYTFASFWEYDSWGRIKRLVYPDGEEVLYNYDQGGKLNRIQEAISGVKYVENIYYDKFENKIKEELGNGTAMEFEYSADMRRLSNLKATHQGTEFLDVDYSYDQVGNILAINNRAQAKDNIGGPFEHEYTYDNLYRLASANGVNGAAHYELNMSYSASGNIVNKNADADVLDLSSGLVNIIFNNDYAYNPIKPHQITEITDQNSGITSNFEWDNNGNMALHSEHKNGFTNQRRMCWDEENRMILSADQEQMAGYVYDAGGMRTHKASGTVLYSTVNGYPNSFATVSAFTLYPSELMTISSGMYTKHYYNGASRVASRVGGGFGQHNDLNNYQPLVDHVPLQNANDYAYKSQELRNVWSRNAGCAGLQDQLEYSYAFEMGYLFTNQQPDGERYFYHSDHLGSSAFITSENGYATQFLAYQPFGETLAEQQSSTGYYSPFKFSAKEKDPETGYSYFGARYYSPELSVWLGVDPMSDKYPYQSSYTYCGWNPLNIIDPDGRNEFKLTKDKGEVKPVSEQKYYRGAEGNISTTQTDGSIEVDKIVDSRGKELYVNFKSLREPKKFGDIRYYEFESDGEAAGFFEFAARGSDVEWGYAQQGGNAPSYVGTNEGIGHSLFGSFMEQAIGETLTMLIHSHPGAGGPPSADLHGPGGTRVGDLNAAYLSKYPNLLRKVFDVPNNLTYSYDGSTWARGAKYNKSDKGFKP